MNSLNAKKSSMTVESKPIYRWVILGLGFLIYFNMGLVSAVLSAIVTPVMRDLNMTYSQMGFILGTWQLVYIFVAFPLGFLTDRIGPYKSLLLASIIVSLSAVLRAFAVNFETLALFVAVFGVGGSLVSIGLPKLVSVWFLGGERGMATGVNSTGSITGSIVALSLTNSLIIPLVGNWRNAFLVYGSVGILITTVWLFVGRRTPPTSSESQPKVTIAPVKRESLGGAKEVIKSKNVWLIVVIGITSFLSSHGLANWLPTILQQKGMSPDLAGFSTAILNVFAIFGCFLIPRLPHIVGSKKSTISLLLFVQGLAILALGIADGPILWTALALDGLIKGGYMPLLMVILMDMPEVGAKRMGIVGGLYFAVGEIGGFGGPFMLGLLKDITGVFLSGIVFLATVCEAMIVLAFLLKVETQIEE
jgi:cyanate permease